MCKVFPGARCANHTWSDFTKANKRKKEIMQEMSSQTATVGSTRGDVVALAGSSTVDFNTLVDKLREAERDAKEAMLDYESTPVGQKRLADIIEEAQEAGDQESVTINEARLAEAKARREVQVHATHLQTRANRVTKTMSENDQNTYSNIAEVTATRGELLQKYVQENRQQVKMRRLRENRLKDARKRLSTHRDAVEKEQKSLAREAYQSYLDAGVNPDLATRYTEDYITSFRTGWDYFTPDSTHRTPQYGMGEFKVKGAEHEQENLTQIARLQFMQKPKVRKIAKSLQEKNQSYYHSTKNAQRAEKRFTETDTQFKRVTDRFNALKEDYEKSKTDKAQFIALRASGLDQVKTYPVNIQGFRKSAHVNPDGDTNAYALVQYGERNKPYYAKVKGLVVKDNHQVVLLENGQTITPQDFAHMDITLTAPQEGSRRMF